MATCPWCDAPRGDGPRCGKCGAIYAKAEALRAHGVVDEAPPRPPARWAGDDDDARLERRLRLGALPVALLLAVAFHAWPLGHFLQRTFLSMMIHELGHASAAWLSGFAAFPTLWRTSIAESRGLVTPLLLAALLVWLGVYAWRRRWRALAALAAALLLAQAACTLGLRARTAQAFITFAGDGGAMVIGAGLMSLFYFGRETQLYRGWLRWGFLVIGAAAYVDTFATWWAARRDRDVIPFGEIEGVGLSDPSKLSDIHGWATQTMITRYVVLGVACGLALAALWIWGRWLARVTVALVLLSSVLLATAVAQPAPKLVLDSLLEPLERARDAAPALATLQRARATATPAARVVIDRMSSQLQQAPHDARWLVQTTLALARGLAKLYPDDFETQLQAAAKMVATAASADALGLPAGLDEGLAATRQLVARFPKEPRAHGQLGFVTYQSGGDPLAALASYRRCLQLDPALAQCAQHWRHIAADYQRPRCAANDVRPITAFAAGKQRATPRQRSVFSAGQLLYLDEPPLLAVGDIADATDGGNEVLLTLTPAGGAKLPRLSPGAEGERWLVFMVGGDLLLILPVNAALRGPHLRLSALELKLGDWCQRIERRALPPELQPPR